MSKSIPKEVSQHMAMIGRKGGKVSSQKVSNYLSRIGRKGGRSKSRKKIAAIKKNGMAGGWKKYWLSREASARLSKHEEI